MARATAVRATAEGDWPAWLVAAVRALRSAMGWCSHQHVGGVPLDWVIRGAALAGLYVGLRRWLSARAAGGVALAVLLAKEAMDIFGHLTLTKPRKPDWGDVADIATGLAGIALGQLVWKAWQTGHRPNASEAPGPHPD